MTQVPNTPEDRKKWLLDQKNREPLIRGGAGSIYFTGDMSKPKDLKIIVSTRAARVGQGLAHFGGLSEECDTVPGDALKTGINNACREGREEMSELLGYEPALKPENYHFLYTARDDGFFIRNGHGFAINARLHAYEIEREIFDALFPDGATRTDPHKDYKGPEETSHAEVMPFFEALKRQDDYFYAHEYFALWVMAAKMMNQDVMKLVDQVNADMPQGRRVDFNAVAAKMHTGLAELEEFLGTEYQGKLQKYEAGTKKTVSAQKFKR